MREQRIDVVKITPSHFTSLTMHHYTDFTLKWLIFGGESLQSERVRTVFQKGWARAVANHYGPTETTVGVALFPMRNLNDVPDDLVVPVGFPIGQSRFELVDEEGQRLAGEAVGELMIGGPGVAAGYTNDPQLTTTKFYRLPHRMADGPFYASGDLFRRSKTGAYIFIGRKDRQIKIRGYRVDPDAIEALIAYEDDVESAAIFACDSDRPGHSQLVACIVPKQPAEDSVLSMQSLLSRILPAHMMPGRIVLLSTMPVTDNGKVDYKALKAQLSVPARHVENTLHVAGLEGNERVAASAWRQCLGSHPHRYDENFYDAGGDSILAIQLLSLLQNENYPVRASHFYQDPTFTRLIQAMDTELQPAVSPQQGISERYLAPVQHWFFEQFPQGVDRWSQAMVIDAAQKINVAAFRKALDGLLKAHPILGTCFIQRTGGWSVEDNVCEVADIFRCLELQGSAEELENMIERAHQEIAIRTGQLLRIWLLKGLDGHDRLLMVCHHLVIDGVSWRILIDDLARLYESARDNIQRSVAIEPRLYWSWSRQLKTLAATLPAEEVYPEAAANLAKLRNDFRLGPNSEGSANTLWIGFDERQSHALLRDIPRQHCVAIQHLLLAAYVRSVADVLASGGTHLSVDIESHGRQLFEDELEMNRAMGWFTAVYPLIAEVVDGEPVLLTARRLANLAEKQADAGALYGIRRYLSDAPRKSVKGSELCFNFLGHFGLDSDASLGWSWSNLYPGAVRHPDVSRVHLLKLTGRVVANRLTLDLSYSSNVHSRVVPALQLWVVSGEALTVSLCERFRIAMPEAHLINQYGLTESCADITTFDTWGWTAPPDYGSHYVPVGKPFEGTSMVVVDAGQQPLPDGQAGELCIAGLSLCNGYLNRPDQEGQRFVSLNIEGENVRVLRTGDKVIRLASGDLIHLGRIDSQIKLRGYRIEPGEVENLLCDHPSVKQAAIVFDADQQRLVAFLAVREGTYDAEDALIDSLRRYAETTLLPYMRPTTYVLNDVLPTTATGKINRQALRIPDENKPPLTAYVEPQQGIELDIAQAMAEVLGLQRIGATDNFLYLGGNSLQAMKVMALLRTRVTVDIVPSLFFPDPTPRAIARALADAGASRAETELRPVQHGRYCRASFTQERLWVLDRLGGGKAAYTIVWHLQMQGEVNIPALNAALNVIVARHDSLRTRFLERDGECLQEIMPAETLSLDVESLTTGECEQRLNQLANREFDLTRGPLYRFELLQSGDRNFSLAIVLHHIVCDGWSVDVLARELCELYTARVEEREAILPELPVQFADFALWQRQMLDKPEAARRLAYWKNKLQGAPAGLELPTDRPRPAVASYRGAHVPVTLAPETVEALRALAQRQGVTLYMVLLAAFQVVLSRWSGQDDVVVGSPVAGRMLAETEPMIGFFANTLALRGDLSGDPSFETLLHRTRQTALEAYENQDVPFERIVEVLQPVRDLSRQAIFQVMFGLYSPDHQLQMTGLELEGREGRTHSAKIDLNLELTETANEVSGHIEYLTGLWDEETMLRFSSHLLNVLRDVAVDSTRRLSGVDMLGEQQRYQLLTSFNATRAGYPTGYLLHHLFERNAQENPQRLALVFRQQSYTYGELNRRANRLANHLIHSGIGPDDRVALLLERTPAMLVALLGVLKAGAAYVPLDTGYPEERVEYMLRHCQPKLLLGGEDDVAPYGSTGIPCLVLDDEGHSPLVSGVSDCDPEPVLVGLTPENLAYIIYTSGSTGRPKGVMLPHGAVINFLYAMRDRLGFTANDGMLAVTTPSFDIAVLELYLPLITGGRIVLTSRKEMRDGAALARLVAHRDVTFMQATPSTWRMMLEAGWQGSPQLTALCGGEALDRELCNRLVCATRRFWNMYGPTETTVWSTCQRIEDVDTPISIGTPVAETTVRILNGQGLLQPVGVAGELYIGGAGLARGYLWQPELTAERFIPDRYSEEPGMRLYRTGDLARWRRDGTIEYLGRNDHQVKLRGFRIELGEIEACL